MGCRPPGVVARLPQAIVLLLQLGFLLHKVCDAWIPVGGSFRTGVTSPGWFGRTGFEPARQTRMGASKLQLEEVDEDRVVIVRCKETLRAIECFIDWVQSSLSSHSTGLGSCRLTSPPSPARHPPRPTADPRGGNGFDVFGGTSL